MPQNFGCSLADLGDVGMRKDLTQVFAFMALMLSLATLPADAQTEALKSEADVQAFTQRVMTTVASGDLGQAYAALKYYSVLPPGDVDAGMQASIAQRNAQFLERYGKTVGYDLISRKKLGKSMLRFVYIEKTEKQPLPWVFHFYLADKGWVLSEFGWDGNPAALYVTE